MYVSMCVYVVCSGKGGKEIESVSVSGVYKSNYVKEIKRMERKQMANLADAWVFPFLLQGSASH